MITHPVTGERPQVRRHGRQLVVSNSYWEVVHDPREGGCPVSLRFTNGSGRNFFVRPPSAHIAVNEPDAWARFYRQSFCRRATLAVRERRDGVQVTLRGFFASDEGARLPVDYEQTYTYFDWGLLRVRLRLRVRRPLRRCVVEVSPCSFYLDGHVNRFGLRRTAGGDAVPRGPDVEWRDVTYRRSWADRRGPSENYVPLYFCAFERGVEGIEFYRGGDYAPWDQPFGREAGQAVFRANQVPKGTPFFGADRDAFYIENNVCCDWGDFSTIRQGEHAFEYALGLPFVKPQAAVRRHVFHACVQPRPWPDAAALKRLADSGVTLLRLHDDATRVKPSWPDGLYPPYPPKVLRAMDEMIDNAHKLGLKIVPYFSLKEFHPSCPDYAGNKHAWKRQTTREGKAVLGERGPFGGYMCMAASGWLEYRKRSIDLVLRRHKFDGVYYDHTWSRACRHPKHMGGHAHTDIDQVLDFLRWTRRRVGPDGVVFVHNSACPSMVCENTANLVYLGEHTDPSIPLPGGLSPDMEFVPIAPRNGILYAPWPSEQEGILVHLLEGWPVTVSAATASTKVSDFALDLYGRLTRFGIDRCRFLRAGERPVVTRPDSVFASLYFQRRRALVLAAQLGRQPTRARLCPDLAKAGWKPSDRVAVAGDVAPRRLTVRELARTGLVLTMAPDRPVLVEFRRT